MKIMDRWFAIALGMRAVVFFCAEELERSDRKFFIVTIIKFQSIKTASVHLLYLVLVSVSDRSQIQLAIRSQSDRAKLRICTGWETERSPKKLITDSENVPENRLSKISKCSMHLKPNNPIFYTNLTKSDSSNKK